MAPLSSHWSESENFSLHTRWRRSGLLYVLTLLIRSLSLCFVTLNTPVYSRMAKCSLIVNPILQLLPVFFSFLSNSGSWYCSSTSPIWSICNQDSAQIRAPLRILCSLSHLLGDCLEDTQHLVCTHHQPASPLVLNFLAFPPKLWFSEEGWSSLGFKILYLG